MCEHESAAARGRGRGCTQRLFEFGARLCQTTGDEIEISQLRLQLDTVAPSFARGGHELPRLGHLSAGAKGLRQENVGRWRRRGSDNLPCQGDAGLQVASRQRESRELGVDHGGSTHAIASPLELTFCRGQLAARQMDPRQGV